MIHSMTGYATKTITLTASNGEKAHVSLSIKSLNSRYFETTCKMPSALSALELKFTKKFKAQLKRGHIYFSVYISNPSIFQGSISPSINTLDAYTHAIGKIRTHLHITEPITLEHILRLPNIFNIEENKIDEQSAATLLQAVDELITDVISERTKEGTILEKDIMGRLHVIAQEMSDIDNSYKIMLKEHKEKVHATLQELGADESMLAEARKNALYTMLDKIDIQEEITRFKTHLESLSQHLSSDAVEKGKRLDFTLQELGREINTITAKCSNSTISSHAINIKVEIEKIREQVQNIV